MGEIVKEAKKVRSIPIVETYSNCLNRYQEILFKLYQYFFGVEEFIVRNINELYEKIEKFEKELNIKVPHNTYIIVASLYEKLVEKISWKNIKDIIYCFNSSIKIYHKILGVETDKKQKSRILMEKGNVHLKFAQYKSKKENLIEAIKAYEEALRIRTFYRFSIDYAMIQNNLGTAYRMLAEVECKSENCNKAIKAYKKALKVFSREEFPEFYLLIECNLEKTFIFCRD
ncbi:hypothetical protein DRQ09_07325 [candidate division KSB1 bacterium]|nr:MAG: hypothetical protein DRQ09_07325 [candidate division KSB1 bacterium]